MLDTLADRRAPEAIPIVAFTEPALETWLDGAGARAGRWLRATGFEAKPGAAAPLPGPDGGLDSVLLAVGEAADPWSFAGLPERLGPGDYAFDAARGFEWTERSATAAALGWMLGNYRFDCYESKSSRPAPVAAAPAGADTVLARRLARAVGLARDLINTPANDMGPADLERVARGLAEAHGASLAVTTGAALLEANYPTVHAVGRASARAPRLIDLRWGDGSAPRATLVGKGVCFDSGGLDLKTAAGMRLMKKDMGGAALVLGLAGAVMDAGLGLRLRALIPAVENAVSGDSFRPGDIVRTRAGTTVEVGNTDAEGRLVLCDALAEADGEAPDLLIDAATLTGAARVALGTEVPALFTADDALADDLARHAREEADPLWRLPLWAPYRNLLDSPFADLNNVSEGPYGGAVTAALFLGEFVTQAARWAHIDCMGWNLRARPGRPKGGEAGALRALYALLAERYPAPGARA